MPFPEFERWRWTGVDSRELPKTQSSIRHALPEPEPPPDHGITYEQYRDDVATWSDERLNGVLACMEDNLRNNTMPVAMERVLREAKVARAEGLDAQRNEYTRRNKSLFDELAAEAKRKRQEEVWKEERKEALAAAKEADPEGEAARLKRKAVCAHKEATLRHSDNTDALSAAL